MENGEEGQEGQKKETAPLSCSSPTKGEVGRGGVEIVLGGLAEQELSEGLRGMQTLDV